MADRPHFVVPQSPLASFDAYRSFAGGSALASIGDRSAVDVVFEIERSGLRGRGGGGFPAGVKWNSLRTHACRTRSVVCNAAEGEPGTFKDRFILRTNPYAVVEGVLAAAWAIGAQTVYFALKASFGAERRRLEDALDEIRTAGLVGGIDVRVYAGPDAYLFGEEKALLNAIEGEEPLPRPADDPPYEIGLFATPTSPNPCLVGNAETFAHASTILIHGAESFRGLGSGDTSGTIVVTLSGDVARPGVYEVEAGTPVRAILEGPGGGPADPAHPFKAILSGVANGVLTADRFGTPADFGSLKAAGSGLGSAGFIVYDERRSMASVARWAARFLYVESCDQCFACKTGLEAASTALDDLAAGAPAEPDLAARAVAGARRAPQGNRCYLPVQASILIPSLVSRFAEDFVPEAAAAATPLPLPKLVDHDPDGHTFTLDADAAERLPDWSQPEDGSVRDARQPSRPKFRLGKLDHAHIVVPDREVAARWYFEHLGFEPVQKFDFWAKGFDGGPLQISADGGQTMLALFEASTGHPMIPQKNGIAFSVSADEFIAFARTLPGNIDGPSGRPVETSDIVDFDLCWAVNIADPWGNQYELNCYDYARIRTELIEADGIEPVRYWPRDLYTQYLE